MSGPGDSPDAPRAGGRRPAARTARGTGLPALLVLLVLLGSTAAGLASESDPGSVELAPDEVAAGVTVAGWWLTCGDRRPPAGTAPGSAAGEVAFSGVLPYGTPAMPCAWEGIGWLRRSVEVPTALVGRPLALVGFQSGAFEAWWDDERLGAVGVVSVRPEETVPRFHRIPFVVVPRRAGEAELAIRFANHRLGDFHRVGDRAVFRVRIADPGSAWSELVGLASFRERAFAGFTGVFLSFGLVHFLLWAFYRPIRSNLDFSLLCLVLAVLQFLLTWRWIQPDPTFFVFTEPAMNLTGLLLGWTSIFFVHRLFEGRVGRTGLLYGAFALPIGVWGIIQPAGAVRAVFLMMLVGTAETVRAVVVAWRRGRPGARVVGLGVTALALGFGIGLLANLGFLPRNSTTGFLIPFGSFLVLLLVMSIHLAHRFATVHRDLEARLEEVKRLSAEKLDEVQRRSRSELRRREVELALEQKSRELEEARELQLSMLPRRLPELPDLEIAAAMETATEVGGDYYDFAVGPDGTLTIAIGDATGHGLRAGTMVTATKSLFNAFAGGADRLPETLSRSSLALKRMNLRKLAMALTLVRHRGGRLWIASAGMPPPLIWRAAVGEVEALAVGGMPLGSLARFPYREVEVDLAPGDVVLLMSDGFPERLDPEGELLGYEEATRTFAAAARQTPEEIVGRLRERGEEWAGGRPLDDDVTFVVLRARAEEKVADGPAISGPARERESA